MSETLHHLLDDENKNTIRSIRGAIMLFASFVDMADTDIDASRRRIGTHDDKSTLYSMYTKINPAISEFCSFLILQNMLLLCKTK